MVITQSSEATASVSPLEALSLSTLPPLLLQISLPTGYPLTEAPKLISMRATHLWLPQIGLLNKVLTEMWIAGEGVLYTWVEHLRTGEFLKALGFIREDGKIE